MKIFILFAFFYLANSAEVEKRRVFELIKSYEDIWSGYRLARVAEVEKNFQEVKRIITYSYAIVELEDGDISGSGYGWEIHKTKRDTYGEKLITFDATDHWKPTREPWRPTTDRWEPSTDRWRPTTDSWRPTEYPWATTRAVGYFRFISKEMTWSSARDYCNQLGGRLALADNEFESNQIYRVAHGNLIWIGLSYSGLGSIAQRSSWHTLCGRPPRYDEWGMTNPREPMNDMNHRCAVARNKGDWYSFGCGFRFPFVCQFGKSC